MDFPSAKLFGQDYKFWAEEMVTAIEKKFKNLEEQNRTQISVGNLDVNNTLTIHGLVEYADNAAAVTAGLVAGNLYRTGDIVKVVHD